MSHSKNQTSWELIKDKPQKILVSLTKKSIMPMYKETKRNILIV